MENTEVNMFTSLLEVIRDERKWLDWLASGHCIYVVTSPF